MNIYQHAPNPLDWMLSMIIEKILNNRDDLIEGTFCYQLFENEIFDSALFMELIDNIKICLTKKETINEDIMMKLQDFISWFILNTMHCIICHNDANDFYFIKNMDMNLWYEHYENMLHDVLRATLNTK